MPLAPADPDTEWARIVAALSRRGFLGAGAAVAGMLLAGCGTGPGTDTADTGTVGETVGTTVGDRRAVVPADPQRVVVVEARAGLEFALLAGYPVVASDWDDDSHLVAMLPDGTARLPGDNMTPDPEGILNHDPDLLVVGRAWWEYYQEQGSLSEDIAPVLVADDTTADWRAVMTRQLTEIGRADRARAALDRYDDRVARARAELAPLLAGRTVAMLGVDADGFWTFPNMFPSNVATEIGFDLIGHDPAAAPQIVRLSAEHLDTYRDADLLVVQNPDDPGAQNPAFAALPAARAGRIVELEYANRFGFALTALDLVEDLTAGVVRHLG
ncbi:hypothetical protein GCM10009613_12560 [Pseudonocardia kongjuensis]|uniref:Fe/B12 periplasmic-binding domain-containing protein n=1 Tax=Pseudonocardia kongjuensis TaxID=102227 RepID=A0ABN1XJG7_9PSEU